ncbi:uncharacterized protein [Panulirus ornatus]|uniref:uncharacterized protein n=1 Tax=Panulirus ornatus TaxID=150431 RepID=UPI003A8AA13E
MNGCVLCMFSGATSLIREMVRNLPAGVDADSVFDDETLEAVQEALGTVGSVVLVRFVDNKIWFTFSDSQTALKAVACSPLRIKGHELEVKLKTEAWRAQLEEELALCGDTTVPLTDESLNITETDDSTFSIRNIEGALEELYQSQAGEEDNSIECGEIVEQQRVQVLHSRPPPSRPTPSRPPPPRPTPPGSAPSSPALSRVQPQGPKVMVITKPVRASHLPPASNVVMSQSTASSLDDQTEEIGKPPEKPSRPSRAAASSHTPSQESPTKTLPSAEDPPLTSSLFGVPPPQPSSYPPPSDEKPCVSPFGVPPPLPDNCPAVGLLSSRNDVKKTSSSPFDAPPSLPPNLPSGHPSSIPQKEPFAGQQMGSPPFLPSNGPSSDSPSCDPPSGPPPGPPPVLPSDKSTSTSAKDLPPVIPARSRPPVPGRTGTGPPPPIPSRNLPPVPARNLPPVPPRK